MCVLDRYQFRKHRGLGGGFLLHLFCSNLRLHDNTLRIQLNIRTAARFETAIAFGRRVVIIRVRESILLPSQAADSILYRVENHLGVLDPRQVEVLCEVIHQLLHADVISAATKAPGRFRNASRVPAMLVISSPSFFSFFDARSASHSWP